MINAAQTAAHGTEGGKGHSKAESTGSLALRASEAGSPVPPPGPDASDCPSGEWPRPEAVSLHWPLPALCLHTALMGDAGFQTSKQAVPLACPRDSSEPRVCSWTAL